MIVLGRAPLSPEFLERYCPKLFLADAGVELVIRADLPSPPFPIAEAPNVVQHLAAAP